MGLPLTIKPLEVAVCVQPFSIARHTEPGTAMGEVHHWYLKIDMFV